MPKWHLVWQKVKAVSPLGFASISQVLGQSGLGAVCVLEKNCLYWDLPELVILGASGL